jgi:hypothetical protein
MYSRRLDRIRPLQFITSQANGTKNKLSVGTSEEAEKWLDFLSPSFFDELNNRKE